MISQNNEILSQNNEIVKNRNGKQTSNFFLRIYVTNGLPYLTLGPNNLMMCLNNIALLKS